MKDLGYIVKNNCSMTRIVARYVYILNSTVDLINDASLEVTSIKQLDNEALCKDNRIVLASLNDALKTIAKTVEKTNAVESVHHIILYEVTALTEDNEVVKCFVMNDFKTTINSETGDFDFANEMRAKAQRLRDKLERLTKYQEVLLTILEDADYITDASSIERLLVDETASRDFIFALYSSHLTSLQKQLHQKDRDEIAALLVFENLE